MKKLILLLVAFAFTLAQMSAQESTFKKGDKVLNLGIGFGTGLYTGSYYKTTVPAISASFEVGVHEFDWKGSIGVGGYLGYSAHKWEISGYGWKYSNFIIGGRGSFHYPLVNKLDTYAGLVLGYNISSSKEFGTTGSYPYDPSSGGIVYAGFVGARYYLSDSFGVMGELGFGIAYFNIGVSLKF